jgi:Rap1a immunity proteins
MKLKLSLQLSALVLSSSFATAEMKTGNDLLPACNAAVDFMDKHEVRSGAMECVAYVNGFIDGEQLGEFAASGNNVICPEKNVSTGQFIRVAVKWMKDHPDKLNDPASACLFLAFKEAFGCKRPVAK